MVLVLKIMERHKQKSMVVLREKIWKWKEVFESKGLKVNLGKTKLVVSGVKNVKCL